MRRLDFSNWRWPPNRAQHSPWFLRSLVWLLVSARRLTVTTPAPAPEQAPVSTAEQQPGDGYVGVPESSPNSASLSPAPEPAGSVEAPEQINMDAADVENQLVKTEVLARIDLMPRLTPRKKTSSTCRWNAPAGWAKLSPSLLRPAR